MTQVVTELIIDGRDATSGAAAYEQAMARVEAAHRKATDAQQRQGSLLPPGTPQSVDRATMAFARLQASIDPVAAAGHRAAQEMTRAMALVDRAVMLGVTTQIEADATIARLRQRQIDDVERVWLAQQKLNDTPANDNVAGARRFNTGNIAAQFQDIGVTAAMGMNPLTIALQQGTQLSAVFAQMEDPIRGVGEAFKSIISPTALVTIGLVALVAVGLQFVDWPKLAAGAMNLLADSLETIAPYAAIAAAGLALLYAPAIISGVVSVIALLGRLAVAAVIAAGAMAAANPALALVAGFTIAVAAGNIFRDELTKIFGVDIVGVVKDAANYILNSFTAAYEDLKFIWNNFGDIMGAAVIGGVNLAIGAVNGLLKSAGEGLDWWIEKLNRIPGVAINKVGDSLKLDTLDNPAADRVAAANAAHKSNIDEILGRDTIGAFGEGIANGASAASAKLKELAADLTKVDDKTKKCSERQSYYDREVRQIQERTEALRNETSVLNLSTYERERMAAVTDLLNAAHRDGSELGKRFADAQKLITAKVADLSPELVRQRNHLLEVANGWAKVAAEAEDAQQHQENLKFMRDLTRGFIDDLRSGLEQGKGFWESFGSAALNVLDRITSKLLDEVLDALFQVNNAGSGSGGGGLMGWLFKGIGALFGGLGGGGADPWAGLRLDRAPAVSTPAVSMSLGRQPSAALAAPRMHAPSNQNVAGRQSIDVQVGVSVDDDGKIQAYVSRVDQRTDDKLVAFDKAIPDKIEAHKAAPRRRSA